MWIQVRARKKDVDEDLIALDIDPSHQELYWASCAIRTEDVADFYALTDNKLVLSFYDERPQMVIKEAFDTFNKRVSELDYDDFEEKDNPNN
jgi:hypothetical protein